MRRTIQEQVEAALRARGDHQAERGARRTVWSRNFRASRADGKLVPVPGNQWFFLGTAGSVRVGTTYALSRPLQDDVKAALVAEGAAALEAAE